MLSNTISNTSTNIRKMSRALLVTLALAAFVATSTQLEFPISLEEVITGSWQRSFVENTVTPLRVPSNNMSHITQQVDNFDNLNGATYQQRFISNNQYYRAGGPIYVIFGGLQPISHDQLTYSLISSVARSEHGHLFLLESRFFGESIPTANLSTANLQYLTIEQILADAAHFVGHIKEVTPGAQDSPVIVVGTHYGGSLAIWFRQKYPLLSDGAWGSSAPLESLFNNQQFKVNAAATIREMAGDRCYNVLDAGFRAMEETANAGGLAELTKALNVCSYEPLENDNDVSTLFLVVSDIFSSISSIRNYVPYVCDILVQVNETTANPKTALSAAIHNITMYGCLTVNYEILLEAQNLIGLTSYQAYHGLRQKTYLMCTQLGAFSTSESPYQPFGSFYPLAFFTQLCTDIFGKAIAGHAITQENQNRFNAEHGGVNPTISNALFTHGELDPARNLGVQSDLHETAVALEIPDAATSYDVYKIRTGDAQELIEAKLHIMAVIRSWTRFSK